MRSTDGNISDFSSLISFVLNEKAQCMARMYLEVDGLYLNYVIVAADDGRSPAM
jgi:hypothetical protein